MTPEMTQDAVADLQGKVVLVTGGGSGIGAAIAETFATLGAQLAIHYHQSHSKTVAERVEGINAGGGEAISLQADFTIPQEVRGTVVKTLEHFGRLDILINNAGSMVARRPFLELTDDFIDQVFNLNARSVILACQAALPAFKQQGGGNIINVSSISARSGGSPGSSIYSAAKAFVSTLTRSLASEFAADNIRVNAISPGTIDTAFHERFSTPEKLARTSQAIPLGRLGQADDCVGTALYLASDQLSGYVTGQVIEVNGGQLMA